MHILYIIYDTLKQSLFKSLATYSLNRAATVGKSEENLFLTSCHLMCAV